MDRTVEKKIYTKPFKQTTVSFNYAFVSLITAKS